MPEPGLARARERFKRSLRTQCVVRDDVEEHRDDVLNPVTLELEPPSGDAPTVYSGRCSLSPINNLADPALVAEGETLESKALHRWTLPWEAPAISEGAEVEIVAGTDPSLDDPQLIGSTFRVRRRLSGSYEVARRYIVEERKPGERIR